MQIHPTILGFMAEEHLQQLKRDAGSRLPIAEPEPQVDMTDVQLRLCTVEDDEALADLAVLAERPLPYGRLVVAFVSGRLVAALPLAGGGPITDPFVRTSHIVPLLELRAKQLRANKGKRWWFVPSYVNLMRGSTHA
ncbi:MAG TPA: hypothetical protein VGQ38_02430 [Gaiellaceae bacterium]|jgi:hypothetical protein|nr:hypothetical protein [Gaiellaceae bacterium]